MESGDVAIRNLTYGLFVDRGHAPTVSDVAAEAASTPEEVRAAWVRLHDAHALVLQPGTTEIRMLNPFAANPTAYRVHAADRWWYANCAWDAFGICAALHVDGRIETSCAECGEVIECDVRSQKPSDETLLFHCLVPAKLWWNDIAFT